MEERITVTVKLDDFIKELNLKVLYEGRGEMPLNNISVCRPGLLLAGWTDYFDATRIQILGNAEYEYLKKCGKAERKTNLKRLFSYQVPCVIISRDLPLMPELLEYAEKSLCPVLRSEKITAFLENDLIMYLNKTLAPKTTVHGVLLDVYGVGTLLIGDSGIGKSESALELVKNGHRLVADDAVIIKNISNTLIGTAPDMIRYFMELRGIGIVDIRSMYGTGSVLLEKEIELVLELEKWEEGKSYERLGDVNSEHTILGITKPKIIIPVRTGRNISIIIEVAARNYRLKSMGYDAAMELINKSGLS